MLYYVEFISRFILCILFSLLIGYEWDSRNQFGLKLYMLVTTGTFLFVSLANNSSSVDFTRIAA